MSSRSVHGTATRAQIPGYTIAGKTGTAAKLINGHYSVFGLYPGTYRIQAVEPGTTPVPVNTLLPGTDSVGTDRTMSLFAESYVDLDQLRDHARVVAGCAMEILTTERDRWVQ